MNFDGKTGIYYSDSIDGYKVDAIFTVELDDFMDTIRDLNDESFFGDMKKNETKCLTNTLKNISLD
jgi:hypothetical protein